MSLVDRIPVDNKRIEEFTGRCPTLRIVLDYILTGRPSKVDDDDFKPYFIRRTELNVDQGIVLWGCR